VKWEYKLIDFSYKNMQEIETSLNKLGAEGWELISMVKREAVLKRVKP
jgi:hypothetical protein